MIKKMSKATSILVAAAAVISLLPATGVNAATKQLETKEGSIEKAIAFDGGKYIFDGYKGNSNDTGVYYSDGTNDKVLDSISEDSMTKYGSKYASIKDGADEYLVDLSNGSFANDTASDSKDFLQTKLKSTLSKTDRYNQMSSFTALNQIEAGQFGEDWYAYTATTGAAVHSGYASDSAKYIDTDVTANMYVTTGAKTVKVDEFDKANSGSDIVVSIDKTTPIREIAQDKDYIYRLVKVNITNAKFTTATYIQKISKAQGDTKDGAYLPKSVTSYEVSVNATFDVSDATNAATVIADTTAQFRVINGVLYATQNTGSKVTVTTINLKKDKASLVGDKTTKYDVYLAEKDVQKDQDITSADAASIDVDGNTWALNDGKIYKFDGAGFTQVYAADSGLDKLDVYNENSLVAWESGKDIYAVVGNKADTTTPPAETPAVTAGWVKNADGTWSFNKADGTKSTGWVQDGAWYYLNANGIMQTGWVNDNGTWYFLNASGAMKTGWVNDNGTWYYLKSSGAMATGWVNDNGTWYYLNASGAMLANTTVDGYKLGTSGAWIK